MSSARFRELALALPEAEAGSHFGKTDMRVRGRIFAGFTATGNAYVKLTAEQQQMVMEAEPAVIAAIPGGWGRKGWTLVDQEKADEALMRSVLRMAWQNVAPRSLQK